MAYEIIGTSTHFLIQPVGLASGQKPFPFTIFTKPVIEVQAGKLSFSQDGKTLALDINSDTINSINGIAFSSITGTETDANLINAIVIERIVDILNA